MSMVAEPKLEVEGILNTHGKVFNNGSGIIGMRIEFSVVKRLVSNFQFRLTSLAQKLSFLFQSSRSESAGDFIFQCEHQELGD